MYLEEELSRKAAVERYLAGESASAICRSLGWSRNWFHKWVHRDRQGDKNWFEDRSLRPHRYPGRTSSDVEAIVLTARHLSTLQVQVIGALNEDDWSRHRIVRVLSGRL